MFSLSVAASMDLLTVRAVRLPSLDTYEMAQQGIQRADLVDVPYGVLEKNIGLNILPVEEAALSLDGMM
jgi:hypothetical protein